MSFVFGFYFASSLAIKGFMLKVLDRFLYIRIGKELPGDHTRCRLVDHPIARASSR